MLIQNPQLLPFLVSQMDLSAPFASVLVATGASRKAKAQQKANVAATTPPEGITQKEASQAFAEAVKSIDCLSQLQLTQLRSIIDSKLIPSGLVVQISRRKAISEISGHGKGPLKGPNGPSGSGSKGAGKSASSKGKRHRPVPHFKPELVETFNGFPQVAERQLEQNTVPYFWG